MEHGKQYSNDSFFLMCENAHKALITKYQPTLAELSGVEQSAHKNRNIKKGMKGSCQSIGICVVEQSKH